MRQRVEIQAIDNESNAIGDKTQNKDTKKLQIEKVVQVIKLELAKA
jgi:hypothetical protein